MQLGGNHEMNLILIGRGDDLKITKQLVLEQWKEKFGGTTANNAENNKPIPPPNIISVDCDFCNTFQKGFKIENYLTNTISES